LNLHHISNIVKEDIWKRAEWSRWGARLYCNERLCSFCTLKVQDD